MSGVLTPTQRAVLELVGCGLTTKEIAARLAISPATVETHVRAAIERLGARTRLQAVARAGVPGEREDATELLVLHSDEHHLLSLMAEGATMREAAASMHLSRRTCARRLAAAKTKLGAHSTVEAVLQAARDHAYALLLGFAAGAQAVADLLDVLDDPLALVFVAPF